MQCFLRSEARAGRVLAPTPLTWNGVKDGALDRMTGSPVGQACVIIAFALYAVGFVLIRRMSRIDV